LEADSCGIRATAQAPFAVIYKGHSVGEYFADILVEDVLVVELKCGWKRIAMGFRWRKAKWVRLNLAGVSHGAKVKPGYPMQDE